MLTISFFEEFQGQSTKWEKVFFEPFLLTEIKEWLFLAFFPQEDSNKLNQLRGQLTLFLKAVSKALSAELEVGYSYEKKEPILDEIIRNIPSENSTSITINPSATIDTLNLEFNNILRR